MWLRDFVVVKKVELEGVNTAKIVLTTKGRPLGSSIYAPDEAGSISVRHESPKLLRLFEVDNSPLYDGFRKHLYGAFPSIEAASPSLRFIGDVSLIGEGASASLTDSGRSVTHKLTVEVGFDLNDELSATVPGKLLLLREFTCVAVEVQRELPLDAEAKGKSKKAKPKQVNIEELKAGVEVAPVVEAADPVEQMQAIAEDVGGDSGSLLEHGFGGHDVGPAAKKFALPPQEDGETDAQWFGRGLRAWGGNVSLGVLAKAAGSNIGTVRKVVEDAQDILGVNPNGSVFSRAEIADAVMQPA